ncbi:plasmid stabilization protein [Aliifodinibius salipaludis]|uniref:Plasmid stabilization protein n=1 Tax=Fodinibius salipaludis TaxID=2032627 RepID=A0A2A2GBX4_9BACT|nr:type II toxin-antitoxin system RelE/ParE family toxin [Aliifodinibius salipaludis]PAU95206.1 plasmid stabilization protein [Aliifodinibius salipaludis]
MSNSFNLLFTNKAYKEVKKLDQDVQRQIIDAAEDLLRDPRPQNSRQLRGELSNYRRLRTGDYRVIYQIKDKELEIVVVRAGHRKDIYD